LREAQSAGI